MGNRSGRRSRRANRRRSRSNRSAGSLSRSRRGHARRPSSQVKAPPDAVASTTKTDPAARIPAIGTVPRVAAALIGVAIAMALTGLTKRFGGVRADSIPTQGEILGGVLMALAVGVRLPHGLATWMCAHTWRRLTARSGEPGHAPPALVRGAVERPLRYLVVSSTALVAGLATALTPVTTEFVLAGHAWMATNFFWMPVPLAVLRMVTALAAAALPFVLLGLCVSCVHHLMCRYGLWDTKATAWVLAGAAAGLVACSPIDGGARTANVLLAAAALPSLVVALCCAVTGTSGGQAAPASGTEPPPPVWSDLWPTLLRAAIVAMAAGTALVICATGSLLASITGGSTVTSALVVSALALGMAVGSRAKRNGLRSIGGFGVACTGAGGALALSWLVAQVSVAAMPGSAYFIWFALAWGGYGVAYGHQTLLHRVGNRSAVGAATLARVLVVAALIAWVSAPTLHALVSTGTVMAVVSLGFVAVGGLLIIHEPNYSTRTRRVRLCAVFGLIAAMIVAVKLAPRRPPIPAAAPVTDDSPPPPAALAYDAAEPRS